MRGRNAMHELPGLTDLNRATIDHDGSYRPISDMAYRRVPHTVGNITVVFADHARLLCDEIGKSQVVIGCVAWLTNNDVLNALQGREVGIIVQKEDWLRPDSADWSRQKQRYQYVLLTGIKDKFAFGGGYNYCGAPDMDAIMCCGILGTQQQMAARMHHKFLVFGHYVTTEELVPGGNEYGEPDTIEMTTFHPQAVWTGSFNITHNATQSLENALLIRDPAIAALYTIEWLTVLGLSEPLDWNATWVATNMRVGS